MQTVTKSKSTTKRTTEEVTDTDTPTTRDEEVEELLEEANEQLDAIDALLDEEIDMRPDFDPDMEYWAEWNDDINGLDYALKTKDGKLERVTAGEAIMRGAVWVKQGGCGFGHYEERN